MTTETEPTDNPLSFKALIPDAIVRAEAREHVLGRWRILQDQAEGLNDDEVAHLLTDLGPDFGGWLMRFFLGGLWLVFIPFAGVHMFADIQANLWARVITNIVLGFVAAFGSFKAFQYFENETWDYKNSPGTPRSEKAKAAIRKLHRAGHLFEFFRHCVNNEAGSRKSA